ncbi:hypothetical protein CBW52_18800 [Yersinia kristensenii]|uniref:Uncharacterized protein n=1 Tax=Yersinia kristensenii TaxID=28152 RepID=A0AB73NGN5_YERKR|nr:hypothetical protein CBW52_18800 [Yersinia kristensenii]
MGRMSMIKKKIVDNILVILGGLLGGVAVWLTLFFIFYFDTWSARLFSIFVMSVCIYLISKFFNRFYPR